MSAGPWGLFLTLLAWAGGVFCIGLAVLLLFAILCWLVFASRGKTE